MHKHSATWEHKHVYFYLVAYQMKKLPKNCKNPMMDGKKIIKKWQFWRKEMKGKSESPE